MVHALRECWRVLAPDGQLIDLRPQTSRPDVELVFNDAIIVAGQIDDSAAEGDDKAADRAVAAVVSGGWFVELEKRRFSFAFQWPTMTQMETYIAEQWCDFAVLSRDVAARARRIASEDRPVWFRVRERMTIATYRKRAVSSV